MKKQKLYFPPTTEEQRNFCKELDEQSIPFVVIGGIAIFAWTASNTPYDIDILIEPSVENVSRLLKIDPKFKCGSVDLVKMANSNTRLWINDHKIDLFTCPRDIKFETVHRNQVFVSSGENALPVASIETLINFEELAIKDAKNAHPIDYDRIQKSSQNLEWLNSCQSDDINKRSDSA